VGDVKTVRALFLETVEALRKRDLPASDLATRVKLSKTPEAYLAKRLAHQEAAYEALLNAGRSLWYPGERVRFYRSRKKIAVWLPDETEETRVTDGWRGQRNGKETVPPLEALPAHDEIANRRDYDVEHYIQLLVTSYAARLRKAFAPDDFEQLFRLDTQLSLFDLDRPIANIQPRWIRCQDVTGETRTISEASHFENKINFIPD
jgi:hypothetical protein